MAEELEQNDGSWSGLKKTVVGVLGTVVTAGGVYVTTLIGGGKEEAPAPVQQAPAPVINITNSNQQQQSSGGTTVIVKEKEVPAKETKEKPKKDGDEFKNTEPKW